MRDKLPEIRRIALSAIATAAVMWLLMYAPTPYVVYEPGIAVPVGPMIELEEDAATGEEKAEGGAFMLTAVKLTEPNFWTVAMAGLDRHRDVFPKREVFRGASREQYAQRLTVIMQGSQNDALEAAYRYAGIPYKKEARSIAITGSTAMAGQPAGPFQPGDKLLGLTEGERFYGIQDALNKLGAADVRNGKLVLDAERGGTVISLEINLPTEGMPERIDVERLGKLLGVQGFAEHRAIVPEEPGRRIAIGAGEIGGPSAGLVFALQAINLLTEEDLTGGARIAATGTITAEGRVGPIGGIRQKVVSTSAEGADLFLVPKSNEQEARSKAASLETKMIIVGVDSLQEAIEAIASYAENRLKR